MEENDEPPSKVPKKEGTTRKDIARAHHGEVLKKFHISESLVVASPLISVSVELLLALIHFQPKMTPLCHTIQRILGFNDEGVDKKEIERFRRAVQRIKKEADTRTRRADKSFDFENSCAFNREFFLADQVSASSIGSSKKNTELVEGLMQGGSDSCTDFILNSSSAIVLENKPNERCARELEKLKEKYKALQQVVRSLKAWKVYHQKSNSAPAFKKSLKRANKNFTKTINSFSSKTKALKESRITVREQNNQILFLQKKVDLLTDRVVDLKEGKSFSNQTALAVISLKSLGVADSKVGDVIKVVGKLAGISFNFVPSASTCRNFALAALYLGKSHIQSKISGILEKGENLCLASDETTKGTTKMQAFGVHSSDGTFLCLGIEQVAEKSAQTAFEALVSSVNKMPGAPTDFFKKFVVSVNSTMSDSAQTEHKFNKLVQKFREEVIPEVVENFASMSDGEKTEASNFFQFFCQLHVLSNYTKIVLKSLLEHEMALTGATKLAEPSVLVLVKLIAQLFGQRGAGMHGVLTAWVAWCKERQINRFVFESFLGNRFNIVFFLASRVFFHRHHLLDFTEECADYKPELKQIRELLATPMIIDHLQVLGFCDQLITGPLWRLAENSEHVLNTCRYALQLQNWLEECTRFPGSFFDGNSPSPNLQTTSKTTSDLLFRVLVQSVTSNEGLQAAALVSSASLEYFSKAFVDFLPGGKHCANTNNQNIRKSTQSAPATNRNVESVFGFISHLFDSKPNMRLDVRVAFTLISKNQTLAWLDSLPEDYRDSILTESRAALSQLRVDAHERQTAVEKVVLQKIREKNQAVAKKSSKQAKDRRVCTSEIVRLGFWQSVSEVDNNLDKLASEKLKRDALTSQIRFRQRVLDQPAPPKFYVLSNNQKPLPVEDLIRKLHVLIDEDAQKGDFLVASDHELVGKKFSGKFPDSNGDVIKEGFITDVREPFISLQYNDEEIDRTIPFDFFSKLVSEGIVKIF